MIFTFLIMLLNGYVTVQSAKRGEVFFPVVCGAITLILFLDLIAKLSAL